MYISDVMHIDFSEQITRSKSEHFRIKPPKEKQTQSPAATELSKDELSSGCTPTHLDAL